MITIRQAVREDVPRIMKFIDEHWRQNYILGYDEEFFCWQFMREEEVTVIIAMDEESDIVYGMQGFMYYNDTSHPDLGGSIWKVIKSGDPILGLKLDEELKRVTNYRWYCSPGLSNRALKIGKLQGGIPTYLNHYYRIGYVNEFRIAKIQHCHRREYMQALGVRFEKIETPQEFDEVFSEDYLSSYLPYKGQRYFKWRYYDHPIYKYDIYGIRLADGRMRSALIFREVECEGHRCLRMVDYVGMEEDFAYIGHELDHMLREKKYEFIDFYQYGFQKETVLKAGFTLRDAEDENVIPNYFEPFVRENVDIGFLMPWGEFRMVRGDADQDRPTEIREERLKHTKE